MIFKNIGERWTLRLIVITPLVALAILTVVITSFYIDKMDFYFQKNAERYLSEYVAGEKRQGEAFVQDIDLLTQYTIDHLDENIKKELDERIALAYTIASTIYDKYHKTLPSKQIKGHIIDALSAMQWHGEKNYIFITDYDGNNILSGAKDLIGKNLTKYEDADGRAIILEEIHIARKYGEGYINSRFRASTGLQVMKVKDFKHFGWFFGSGIHVKHSLHEKKEALLRLLKRSPKDRSGYIAIFENSQLRFVSTQDEKELPASLFAKIQEHLVSKAGWLELPQESAHIYVRYIKALNWHVVYGFKKAYFSAVLKAQQKKVRDNFDNEVTFVVEVSMAIAFLVGLLTFIVSRHIIAIIEAYKVELDHKEHALRELNSSLAARVHEEVNAHREKDKMLIQQSKMAAMGDMLSMIAHQWRQPLNQMSYLLMNIESAYEYKEMTPHYMQEKVNEGTKLLEYMSHTIDDFKNFFKPDKARSDEQLSDVINATISLVQKSLDTHNITLHVNCNSTISLLIYRNELLQVLLNLLSNAKDALLMKAIEKPEIWIDLFDENHNAVIEVSDNAGGVDETIMEKIFEPYFSTKGEQSGTGLGLYMVKTIVERHLNGTILIENKTHGACFKVILQTSLTSTSPLQT